MFKLSLSAEVTHTRMNNWGMLCEAFVRVCVSARNPAIVYPLSLSHLPPPFPPPPSPHTLFFIQLKFGWRFTRSDLRGSEDLHLMIIALKLWYLLHPYTKLHVHICRLKCPNNRLGLPPEESGARHSWQWDFWVFYSPRANPPQPQIDLISDGAK